MSKSIFANGLHIHISEETLSCLPQACHDLPVVILLHGWLGTHVDLVPLAQHLANKKYRVFVPDLPYHGKSDVEPSSLRESARMVIDALLQVLQPLNRNPSPIALLGYSLGGRVALEMTILINSEYSSMLRVRALVLVSSAPHPITEQECRERAAHGKHVASLLRKVQPSEEGIRQWLLDSWYSAPMWGGLKTEPGFLSIVERRAKGFDATQQASWIKAAMQMAKYEPIGHELTLHVPLLYVYGALDEKYAKFVKELSAMFTPFTTAPFEGAGHNVLVQCSSVAAFTVAKFIAEAHPPFSCDKVVRLDSVKTLKYSLPLRKPFLVGRHNVSHREGVLVVITSSDGDCGIGDVCPLPGLHRVNLDSCMVDLQCFVRTAKAAGRKLCSECSALSQLATLTEGLSPVVSNAIHCAVFHMLSQATKTALASYLQQQGIYRQQRSIHEDPQGLVHINGVLPRIKCNKNAQIRTTTQDKVDKYTDRLCFQVLKLKVGAYDNGGLEAVEVKASIQGILNRERRVRLDANRSWTLPEFCNFQQTLGQEIRRIEFIEEPLQKVNDLRRYLKTNNLDMMEVALDENLAECSFETVEELAASPLCRALVVKPCVVGSLASMFKLCCISRRAKCRFILSSTFDSGIGIAWAAILAAALASPGEHHGLATFDYLMEDVHDPSFKDMCVVMTEGSAGRPEPKISVPDCEEFLNVVATKVITSGAEIMRAVPYSKQPPLRPVKK